MPRDSLSPTVRLRRCKKMSPSSRLENRASRTSRLRLRTLQNIRSSTICLSDTDSEPEEILPARAPQILLEATLDMGINEVTSFCDNIESDVNQFNSEILSDLIENDFPIEYHDQTLDITADDEVECVDLCSGTNEKKISTSSSTLEIPAIKTECPICLEDFNPLKPMYSTFCGHIFCKDCIFQVLRNSKKCPNCRKAINKSKVHPLFLN